MRGTAVAVLLALASFVAGGCGDSSARDDVEGYLKRVKSVQTASQPALVRANRVYVRFLRGKLPARRAPVALTGAEASIRRARRTVARLDPPADARKLHRLLLGVYDANARLARETTLLGRYSPARVRALRPLARVNRRLGRELPRAGGPDGQAAVLGRYGDAVGRIVARLRRLHPPPVAASAHRALVARLGSLGSLARRLRAAVRERDPKRVARLLVRFRKLTTGRSGTEAISARAVAAYTRRREAIGHRVAAMNRELARLDRRLSKR
jgi:hypothetical protein